MTNSKLLLQDFMRQIRISEDASEIENIALISLEEIFGLTRSDLLLNKSIGVRDGQMARMNQFIERINACEPIQHIIGYAYFLGNRFIVNRNVLIPRPETEELVMLALKETHDKQSPKILDIATGSGCIPISLSLEKTEAIVYGTDVSIEALGVARENNDQLKGKVNFLKHDVLLDEITLTNFDLITSNPPYIALSEKSKMQQQVVDFEPHLALFVSDDDPLIFYRSIAKKSLPILNTGGVLMLEINQRFGREVGELLAGTGFKDVKIIKDISGNDRIAVGKN